MTSWRQPPGQECYPLRNNLHFGDPPPHTRAGIRASTTLSNSASRCYIMFFAKRPGYPPRPPADAVIAFVGNESGNGPVLFSKTTRKISDLMQIAS